MEALRRVIANQTEEERASANKWNRQGMAEIVPGRQQNDMKPDLRRHGCEHGDRDSTDVNHFNVKMINPVGEEENKKCNAMNYYSYRLMIRENEDNHILKCRQLFHQCIVDMYAKIETEHLIFIRLDQIKLRSEKYIHLRGAVVNDAWDDIQQLLLLYIVMRFVSKWRYNVGKNPSNVIPPFVANVIPPFVAFVANGGITLDGFFVNLFLKICR
ncbi:unnamed protein product [Onchocerca ochengi]|uniref:Helitron_like_N domain-containing protein n=1 Tax=Onchocerca ochengi TaxID=42157 RepID=A0A182E602_ONCOC|nr:unnamed protein product [Onchocerca ochengi]